MLRKNGTGIAIGIALGVLAAGAARGEDAAPAPTTFEEVWGQLANGDWWGKIHLDVRARAELADFRGDALDDAQAYTIRTRLGYQSPKWKGLSFFVEGENVSALADDLYFDGVHDPNGQSLIADPETTHLNQGYVRYERSEWALALTGGRQRIVLDDHRFIGNVGWRQNEQTYDAVGGKTSFGLPKLSAYYAYVWYVSRIFGDKRYAPPATRDFDSDSHLVNVSYAVAPWLTATAFTYLLDFDGDAPDNFSSNSYGLRLQGARELAPAWKLSYFASYAYQTDAHEHPVDYGAHYVAADAGVEWARLGSVGIGYELLGSDDGKAQFLTPLATLHAFNGWADAFLDNGGPNGLQDFYVYLGPKLPWGLTAKLVYHRFWSHEGSDHLGDEYDALLSKAITKNLTVLTKVAYFDASPRGPTSRWRFWLEATFKF